MLYLALPAVAQQQTAKSVPSSISNIVGYYEHLPQGYATNTSQRYPLIIFLHGVGELAGNNATQINQAVLKNGIPNYIKNNQFPASFTVGGQSYSFIVLTPQFKVWPGSDDVNKLLAYAESQYRVDSSRVYVTGISMGGGVAWGVLSENAVKAKQYAAAAIVCGAWDPDSRPSLATVIAANNTPVWAFHNDNDPTVAPLWSKNWVKLINASVPAPNPPALLTMFQSNSHDAWTKAFDPAYKDPQIGTNVYEWLLKYNKGGAPNPGNGGKRIVVPRSRGNAIYYEDAKTALNVQPGDTLCINAGDYDFIHMGNLVGTAAKPIIIRNCGGLVRVGINSTTTVASFLLPGGQYFKVEGDGHPGLRYGFDINGTSATGVKLYGLLFSNGATDFEVHHCYVHDAGMFLQAKTLQNCQQPQFLEGAFVMRNVKIHDLLCRNSAWEGFYIGNTHYLWDDGNCKNLKSHHLENLEVYNNDLENVGSDGIQIAMADMGVNVVHHNRIVNYAMARNSAHGYGILSGGGSTLRIYNNRIDKGFSPGVQLFGSGVSYVYNNVISNIYYEGINVTDKLLFQPVTGYIYNNTVYNTGSVGLKIYADLTTVGHKVYNNVVVAPGSPWDYPQQGYYIRGSKQILFDFSNNMSYANAKQGLFADSAGGNYHLTSGSTAINAGRNMQDLGLLTDYDDMARPQDVKFDAGAYEYNGPLTTNIPPAANAGKDTVIAAPGTTAILDGSASADVDGTISVYRWTKLTGPNAGILVNAGGSNTNVTGLVPGTYVFQLLVTDDKGASDSAKVTVNVLASANKAPIAAAGTDMTVTLPNSSAPLSGSNSIDQDGMIVKFEWKKVSGPAAGTIGIPDASNTDVTGLVAGVYVFELTVTDNAGAIGTDRITITVINPGSNQPPVANAGGDKNIQLPLNTVQLDGSASNDPDGTITTWQWTKISGPAGGNIGSPNQAKTNITALQAGVYVFELKVTDNQGAQSTNRATVTVAPAPNKLPVADAGADKTIQLPLNTVQLDGSASNDPDGSIVGWQWTKISGPGGGAISNATQAKTDVTGLQAGVYIYELTVTDDTGAKASDRVTVTVTSAPNKAPVAVAGTDRSVQLPNNMVQLDGSASNDPDGSIVSWQWTKVSGPTQGDISNPNQAITSVTGLVAGIYVFELTVKDNGGMTGSDRVTVTVVAAPVNRPPVVRMPAPLTVNLPVNTATLDGSASTDPDGSIVKWQWVKISGPAGGDMGVANAARVTISNLQAGVYLYELTVTDDGGASVSGRVTVTVVAANQPPVANAGADISINLPANTAQLDGGASRDPDGRIVSWQWAKVSGPAAGTIVTPNAAATQLTGLVAGVYVFELTVTDDGGLTATDRVTVVVLATGGGNRPPVARAGNDLTILLPVNTAQLDGSASSDPDGSIVGWSWRKVSGPAGGDLSSPFTAKTGISSLQAGTYVYELTVTDNGGASASARVTVLVQPVNQPPVANAGSDISVQLPLNTAQLDGSGSTDPDGRIASWRWVKISGPAGGDPTPSNVARPAINNLQAGTYVYELTVTDDGGQTATARVRVIVLPATVNRDPIAIAGNPVTITLPVNSVRLDGSASYDPDGNVVRWAWVKVSGPAGGTIVDAGLAQTMVTGLQEGIYVFELTVTDNQGAQGRARVSVTVQSTSGGNNQPPVAQTQGDRTITLPVNFIQADGTRSFDPDGNIVRYNWRQLSGPGTANIWEADRAQTRIASLQAGTYTFELTVTDNQGAQSAAGFTVKVQQGDQRPDVSILYPNPARDYIRLNVHHKGNTQMRIAIYDLTGKMHYSGKFTAEDGMQQLIYIETIPVGHYLVEVRGEDKYRWTGHFTKVP